MRKVLEKYFDIMQAFEITTSKLERKYKQLGIVIF